MQAVEQWAVRRRAFDAPGRLLQTQGMLIALLIVAAQAAASSSPPADVTGALQADKCKDSKGNEIVVCAERGRSPYRIDPRVLQAERAHAALPPKPPVGTETVASSGCVGGQGRGCTNGGVIPLVGMALTAVKAAELAAHGDDWRDALRTHEDEYRLYKQAEERKAKERGVKIGVSAGN